MEYIADPKPIYRRSTRRSSSGMIGAPEHESEKGNRFPDKIMLKQSDPGWIGISLRRKPKLAPEVATAGVASVQKSSDVVKEGDKVRLLGPGDRGKVRLSMTAIDQPSRLPPSGRAEGMLRLKTLSPSKICEEAAFCRLFFVRIAQTPATVLA